MEKICPVRKAEAEIRGGWDAWDDDEKGRVTVGGVDYVCQNAVFLYTVRKMEYARHTLTGGPTAEFFSRSVGKKRKELYDELCRDLLADATFHVDAAANAAIRAIHALYMIHVGVTQRGAVHSVPLFDEDYAGSLEEIVNRFVKYAIALGEKVDPLPPARADDKADDEIIPQYSAANAKKILDMELDIIRGVGFREAELVAAAAKLVEVELAILRAAEKLVQK